MYHIYAHTIQTYTHIKFDVCNIPSLSHFHIESRYWQFLEIFRRIGRQQKWCAICDGQFGWCPFQCVIIFFLRTRRRCVRRLFVCGNSFFLPFFLFNNDIARFKTSLKFSSVFYFFFRWNFFYWIFKNKIYNLRINWYYFCYRRQSARNSSAISKSNLWCEREKNRLLYYIKNNKSIRNTECPVTCSLGSVIKIRKGVEVMKRIRNIAIQCEFPCVCMCVKILMIYILSMTFFSYQFRYRIWITWNHHRYYCDFPL